MAAKSFEVILPQGILLQKGRAAAAALEAVVGNVWEGQTGLRNVKGLIPHFCGGKIEFRGVCLVSPPAMNITDE